MTFTQLEEVRRKFEAIGARLKVRSVTDIPWWQRPWKFSIDVVNDRKGEFFELIVAAQEVEFVVLNVQQHDRHLLLLAKTDLAHPRRGRRFDSPQRFLCGHDERHWFVASIPSRASTVDQAKEALKPVGVLKSQLKYSIKGKHRHRRTNAAFIRQGEWFFIPEPNLDPDPSVILHNEPMRRSRDGKPHRVEQLYRIGWKVMYTCPDYPEGLTEEGYTDLLQRFPHKQYLPWQLIEEPVAYAKGHVWHPDHHTVVLPIWHRILVNGEVAFTANRYVD